MYIGEVIHQKKNVLKANKPVFFNFPGICVTAIMVLVVGCRMKVVRKRMIRRGGKLPYAHDADFLVNGMYL